LDNGIKQKIEHEIFQIEKQLNDAKPLLDLCKLKEPDFVEITAMAQILHSFYIWYRKYFCIIFEKYK
jgi:hypothetical protein